MDEMSETTTPSEPRIAAIHPSEEFFSQDGGNN